MVMRGRRRGRKRHSAQHGQDPGTATGAGETSTGAVTLVTSTPPPEDASEQLSPEASVMNDTPPAGVAVLPQDEEQGHDRPEPDKPAVAESVEAEVALPVTTAATEVADTAAQGSPTPSVEEVVESVAEPATKLTAESVASDAVRAPQAASGNSLPRVLAVANQKGGVGKTTTSVNLGAALAELGFRVLVIDLDPQGNATTGLGIDARTFELSMYDVLMRDISLEDCVEPTSMKNLFVAPATIALAGAEIELVPAFSRELKLKRAIESVIDEFDYVLIDCPPSLGLITVNALAAAGEVLVPIQCEYYALEGLSQLMRNVHLVASNLNPKLDISTIVLTMYDARTKLSDQVANEVRLHFGAKVCRIVIPRTVRLSEAPSFGQPITAFDPASRGAIAYRELAKEVSGGTS